MESSLENVSKYYDKEIPKAIKGMFAVMEPLILVVMAGVVLFMASAILLPMYNMITKMGQQ
jgi:type II secretory pathway component PulF